VTIFALLLVTISAFTHAFWNYLGKRRNPPAALFLMASLGSSLIFSPVLFTGWAALKLITPVVWVLILITGSVQAVYYIFLAAAYRTGDLSHIYPMARSLPVVFVALISILLGRGDQVQPLAYLGFVLVTAGCILLPMPKFSDLHLRHYWHKWVLFALLAALCITAYTLIDDQSLRILRSLPGSGMSNLEWSLLYVELEAITITIFMLIFILAWRPEREGFLSARGKDWRTAFLMGFIITATYSLVLLAMAYVSNVSYVIAFRQLSIPIGALLGILGHKEKAHPPKLVGIAIIFLGLLIVALG
jgi:drug/metabolite transporter (DMT)-like permease